MSYGSSDCSNLCILCSVSFVENEESELSELEVGLKMLETYQFEPIASSDFLLQSDTEVDNCRCLVLVYKNF